MAPDGKVGVCQDFVKPRKYFGDELTKNPSYDPFENGLYDGWKNRSPFFMEQCYDCEAIALCGGGCPASIELRTGSRWNIDDRICPHSKQSLEWLIWDTYKNMNT
ncbi:MAG: SPASM domain-containing protein [Candidatus Pacebacteria bacterium]|nr:SPASM domain-containing protein [Candidatus Paceibacterota bacterium]